MPPSPSQPRHGPPTPRDSTGEQGQDRWRGIRRSGSARRWFAGALVALLALAAITASGDDGESTAIEPTSSTTEARRTTTSAPPTSTTTEPSTKTSTSTTVPAPTLTTTPPPAPVPTGTPAEVVSVVDGDTVKVDLGGITTTIRIIGIDTPETVHPREPVQCFGAEASLRAGELLEGETVGVEYDGTQGRLDRYGRTLAYLWLPDGRLFTSVMLSEGFAKEYTYSSHYKHRDEHLAAERSARSAGRGLWSTDTCGGEVDRPDDRQPSTAITESDAESGAGAAGDVYYRNCTEARDAGVAPIRRGEPGYRPALDRDRDGIACE